MTSANGYGTVGGQQSSADAFNRNATEEDALLPRKNDNAVSSVANFRRYLNHDVSRDKADLVLLYGYIITGLLDSVATATWGAFVSMQTGNTIYLGMGIADPAASQRWIKSGLSIAGFCFGSFCFSRFHRNLGQRKRWVMVASVSIQMACILAAAIIVHIMAETQPGDGHDLHWHVLLPIVLVAFQSSGQAVISRALQYAALTSVVLTSIYCDLWSDPKLFASLTENVERNRRGAAPVLLLVGAIFGGLWNKSEVGISGALWTAVALKSSIILLWLLWVPEGKEEDRNTTNPNRVQSTEQSARGR